MKDGIRFVVLKVIIGFRKIAAYTVWIIFSLYNFNEKKNASLKFRESVFHLKKKTSFILIEIINIL